MATRRRDSGALPRPAKWLGVLGLTMGLLLPSLAGAEEHEHDLAWVAPPEPDVAGYKVYLGIDDGSSAVSLADGIDIGYQAPDSEGVARFPLGGLDASTTYYVAMTAYDAASNESSLSNLVGIAALCPPEGCAAQCSSDFQCDDGDPCNGTESCAAGECANGSPPVCSSTQACMDSTCEAFVGCVDEAVADETTCDDGDPQSFDDRCSAGNCVGDYECVADSDCADSDVCNGSEACVDFQCVSGAPADGAVCDDGDVSTIDDVCSAGICAGEVPPEPEPECWVDADCADSDVCNGAEICAKGSCVSGAPADGAVCDDGDASTIDDVCSAGICAGEVPASPDDPETDVCYGRPNRPLVAKGREWLRFRWEGPVHPDGARLKIKRAGTRGATVLQARVLSTEGCTATYEVIATDLRPNTRYAYRVNGHKRRRVVWSTWRRARTEQ